MAMDVDLYISFHSDRNRQGEWLKVDLKEVGTIMQVRLFFCTDCWVGRNREFYVRLLEMGDLLLKIIRENQ